MCLFLARKEVVVITYSNMVELVPQPCPSHAYIQVLQSQD